MAQGDGQFGLIRLFLEDSFRLTALILAVLSAFATATAAKEQNRFALVIGNSNYEHVSTLRNPTRDASDIAEVLKETGFDVTLGIDVDRQLLLKQVETLSAKAPPLSIIVFYYAGHGFRIDQKNHLVPVDAVLKSRADIGAETILVSDVIGLLGRNDRQLIVLMDACRNNPLPPGVKTPEDGNGLAEIERAGNLFVAFAAEPQKVALDGVGRNSPFTRALITHIPRPGLSISDMMVDVRRDVYALTIGKQTPVDQSWLRSQFSFLPFKQIPENIAEAARSDSARVEEEELEMIFTAVTDTDDETEAANAQKEQGIKAGAHEDNSPQTQAADSKPADTQALANTTLSETASLNKAKLVSEVAPDTVKEKKEASLPKYDYRIICKGCAEKILGWKKKAKEYANRHASILQCHTAATPTLKGKQQSVGSACGPLSMRNKIPAEAVSYCKKAASQKSNGVPGSLCRVVSGYRISPDKAAIARKKANPFVGECANLLTKWKKERSKKAAAISKNEACGFSWAHSTKAQAEREALKSCRQSSNGSQCRIFHSQ